MYHHSLVRRQTEESIQAFLDASADFQLTLAEQLQIINLCPTTLVEVYLSVDHIESRIGQEKAHELLKVIREKLYVEAEEAEQKVDSGPLLKERSSHSHGKRNGGRGGGRGRNGDRFKPGRGGRGGRGRGQPRNPPPKS